MNRVSAWIVVLFLPFVIPHDVHSQVQAPQGMWKFDDPANLTKAAVGASLECVGTQTAIAGPATDNGAVKIGKGSYYKLRHGLPPSGGMSVNEYTLQIDFRVPDLAVWHCFLQTNPANANDGDCFINPDGNIGVGATGYAAHSIKAKEWYRLVISVKNGSHYRYYLDGQEILDGSQQTIDGRFSLDTVLLLFADEDGEDGEIDCAEVALWNVALPAAEIKTLGGYGHTIPVQPTGQLLLVPYLQNPSTTSMYVCWHDTSALRTTVEFGRTTALGNSGTGTSEIVAGPYRWHSVKLAGLQPNTEYSYRVVSGSGTSALYTFKTLPEKGYGGKIRLLLLSDTHSTDTTMAGKILRAAKTKICELYGSDITSAMNAVLHSGDLVVNGNVITQWTEQYFAPMATISPYVPFMTITGNHEGEHQNYYTYMRYEDMSAFPPSDPLNERFWSFTIANTKIIGLNSNIVTTGGVRQKAWLQEQLQAAEADSSIDFVFLMSHHFPLTELWGEGISYDGGPGYISNEIIPLLKKFSKVVQLSYGHTHGFERGSIESESPVNGGDFRIVCGGGGGGGTDRWGAYVNTDYPSIQIAMDHYFFQLIEIDASKKTFESKMYSLGNASRARDAELMDSWYKKTRQAAPDPPVSSSPVLGKGVVQVNTSAYSGVDSLMTVRIEIDDNPEFTSALVDTLVHWKDVYGVDASFTPIDRNKGLDLTKISFDQTRFIKNKLYYYRVKYRDHNLKWSVWSNVSASGMSTGVYERIRPLEDRMKQNIPNPFNPSTTIRYGLHDRSPVSLTVYNTLGQEIAILQNGVQDAGNYSVRFGGAGLANGVYYYRLQAGSYSETRSMLLLK